MSHECIICREDEREEKLLNGVCDCTGSIKYHKSCLLLNYIITDNPICMTCHKRYACIPNLIPLSGNVIKIKETILRQRRNETQEERDARQCQLFILKMKQDLFYRTRMQMACITQFTMVVFCGFSLPACYYGAIVNDILLIQVFLTLILYYIFGDTIMKSNGRRLDEYDLYLARNEELWVIV